MTLREIAIMTRLPEPGRAKTRLISALGADGAAALHADLVEHTLAEVDRFAERSAVRVTVWIDGPAENAAAAFGRAAAFAQQPPGDLGARMGTAIDAAIAGGATAVVVVGTDCPRLDADVLGEAFASLERTDAVMGPASDGGYYLIGFSARAWSAARETAFAGVPWSSSETASATVRRILSTGLSLAKLAELTDVDEPADLAEWQAVLRERRPEGP